MISSQTSYDGAKDGYDLDESIIKQNQLSKPNWRWSPTSYVGAKPDGAKPVMLET
jgi:hypothetical protein